MPWCLAFGGVQLLKQKEMGFLQKPELEHVVFVKVSKRIQEERPQTS